MSGTFPPPPGEPLSATTYETPPSNGSAGRGYDRVPPHSLEAEVSVLGAAMLSRTAASESGEILRPEDFYRNAHRVVFEGMQALLSTGEPIDTVTVTEWLARRDRLDEVGGPAAIHDLTVAVPTAANAAYYARIVREKALLRRLIDAGTAVAKLGYEAAEDADTVVDRAETLIYDVAQTGSSVDYARLGELLNASFEQIEMLAERGSEVTGLATGFDDLDRLTAGLQPQNLVILAARPAMGKCASGSTRIVDARTGRPRRLDDVVADAAAGIELLAADGGGRLVRAAPSGFHDNGVRPVFQVRTRSGRSVTVTDNHPLLTPDGWRELRELRPGTAVAVPRVIRVEGQRRLAGVAVMQLADVLEAERRGDSPSSATSPVLEAEAIAAASVAVDRRPSTAGRGVGVMSPPSAVASTWTDHEQLGERAAAPSTGCVPDPVFELPADQLALLLSRTFASGGSIRLPDADGYAGLSYPSASEQLVHDLQHLLLRFAIASRITQRGSDRRGAVHRSFHLEITDLGDVGRFLDQIAVLADDEVFATLRAVVGTDRSAPPQGGPAQQGAGPDLLWDEIASIEPAGVERVYDLTVPGWHNFVANDLVVHNSSLALGVSQFVSVKLQKPSIIFSLEMSKLEIVNRLLSSEARIDSSRLRTGRLEDTDWRKLGDALGSLSEAPLFIDDTPSITLMEIRAKSRRLKQKHGLDLIIVDYLQLMQSHRRSENRQQEVSEISRGLKMLAKELDVPVIALSQLSRQPESRTDKRPMLADLRESGSIEQDADIVAFIYRDEVYDEDSPDKGIAELIVSKHRNGATGIVKLAFLDHLTKFANLARGTGGGTGGAGGAGGSPTPI